MAKKNVNKAGKTYKKRKRRRILFAMELIVLLVLVGALFVYAQISGKLDKMEKVELNEEELGIDETVIQNTTLKGYMNIALFGLDSRDGNLTNGNSDTMIIASINNDTKEVRLVSLYRDTYINIGNDSYSKANAAYTKGGPQQAIAMMNSNLDLDIRDYVAVDFDALIEVIDLLGGLEITVTEEEAVHLNNYCVELNEITGKEYKDLPGEGTYDMTGIQATAYARIRYTAGNDFKRTERQREVISKIVDKAKKSDLATLTKIMDKVFPMISTSLSKSKILEMGMSMLSYNLSEQTGFPFTHLEGANVKKKMGSDCVVAVTLQTNVEQLHHFLFENETYTPSETVVERSKYIEKKSGYTEKSIPKEQTEEGEAEEGEEADTEAEE